MKSQGGKVVQKVIKQKATAVKNNDNQIIFNGANNVAAGCPPMA